ncbi:ABC transporter substrate-binding protein [Paenisporosarcina sp.]|uniref:ABC transporter substrate-binding protein n=1 Tax=Paenisporosarcina sp. TaxID=1932001 RepID=UPI003C749D56
MRLNINFDNNLGFKELDPATCQNTSTANILHNIYKGLMTYEGNNLVKGTLNNYLFDKTSNSYTFVLDNSYWSNAKPICSKDFVEAWINVIKKNNFNIQSFKVIKNVEKYLEGICDETEIGLQILNEKSFKVILENSCPYFLHLTASTPYLPIPHSMNLRQIGLISNRDFVIKTRNTNSIVLENLEKTKEICITCDGNEQSIHRRFIQKEIQLSDGIPAEYMDFYAKNNLLKYVPEFGTAFLQFNCEELNLNERIKIDNAINVEKLMESFIQFKATKKYIPWDFYSEYEIEIEENETATEIPEAFLKEKSLNLLVNDIEQYTKIAITCKEQLEKSLNIEVQLVIVNWEEFTEKLYKGEFDIALSGWIGDFFDPISLLNIWETNSPNNFSKFSDHEFDDLVSSSQFIESRVSRFNILKLAESILFEKKTMVPLYNYRLPLLIQDIVSHNFNLSPLGIFDFNSLTYKNEVL